MDERRRIRALLASRSPHGALCASKPPPAPSSKPSPAAPPSIKELFLEKLGTRHKGSLRSAVRSLFKSTMSPSRAASATTSDKLEIKPADLEAAAKRLLPGHSQADIQALVSAFDIDADGRTTVAEFAIVCERAVESVGVTSSNRQLSALPMDQVGKADRPKSSDRAPDTARSTSEASTVLGSEWDRSSTARSLGDGVHKLKDGDTLPHFISHLKSKVERKAEAQLSKKPCRERLQQHHQLGIRALAKQALRDHFDGYRRATHNRNASTSTSSLRSGTKPPTKEQGRPSSSSQRTNDKPLGLKEFAQALSHFRESGQSFPDKHAIEMLWRSCGEGNVETFLNIIYAAPTKQVKDQFGFGRETNNPFAQPPRPTRVEQGPFEVSPQTQVKALRVLSGKPAGLCPQQASQVPSRIRYRHCKTPVQPPSNFNSTAAIAISSQPPTCRLELEHVYGYTCNSDIICGPNLFAVNGGRALLYAAAAVLVVHEVATNSQRFFVGHTDDVCAVAIAPDESMAASGQMGKKPFVALWDIRGGGLVGKLGQGFFQRVVCCIAFCHDGTRLAAVSGDDHHMLGIWNVQTKQLEAEMPAQNGPPPQVLSLVWLPTALSGPGTTGLVTVGRSHFKVWTLTEDRHPQGVKSKTGSAPLRQSKPRLTLRAGLYGRSINAPRVMNCVAVSETDRCIISGGDNGNVYIWKLTPGKPVKEDGSVSYTCVAAFPGHKGAVRTMFTEAPGSLTTGGADGYVRRWDLSSVNKLVEVQSWRPCRVERVQPAITAHVEKFATPFPKDPKMQSIMAQLREKNVTAMRVADMCRLSERAIAVGMRNGRVVVLDVRSGREEDLVRSHHGTLMGLAVHPKKPAVFATAGEDGLLLMWDGTAHRTTTNLVLPAPAHSLAFSPDGSHLAIGFNNGAIAVYDAASLEQLVVKRDCAEAIDELKFSPDGAMLAVGSHDNLVDIYSVKRAYEHIKRLKGHTSYITHLDWSKDSKIIQSNSGDYEICYWDVRSGSMMRSTRDSVEADTEWSTWTCVLGFPVMGIWPADSDGTDINSLDRSKDGRLVCTGDDFGRVNLFNAPVVVNHAPYVEAVGHSSHVMNVRWLADQRILVSVGGHDMSVLQWRMVSEDRQRRF